MDNTTQAPVNEFFARGIVKATGTNPYGSRYLLLVVQDRRNNTMHIDITIDKNVNTIIQPKDRVTVQGYFRGFTFADDVTKKQTYVSFLCATSITKSVPELSLRFPGVEGFFYPDSAFRAFLSGKVEEAIYTDKEKHWGLMRISTMGGGSDKRPSLVEIRYFCGNKSKLPAYDYVPGDIICTRLSINTPERKRRNGEMYYYQNLYVEDIGYLDKMPRKDAEPAVHIPVALDLGLTRPDFDDNTLVKNEAADMMAQLTGSDDDLSGAPEGDQDLI